MKVTTPSDMRYTLVDVVVLLLEEEFLHADRGKDIYSFIITQNISERQAMEVQSIYKFAGWKSVTYEFGVSPDVIGRYVKFTFVRDTIDVSETVKSDIQ